MILSAWAPNSQDQLSSCPLRPGSLLCLDMTPLNPFASFCTSWSSGSFQPILWEAFPASWSRLEPRCGTLTAPQISPPVTVLYLGHPYRGQRHHSSPLPCQDLVPQPSPNICAVKKEQKNVSCSKPQRQVPSPRLTAHNDSKVGNCALEAGEGRSLPGPKSCFPRPHLFPVVLEDEGSAPQPTTQSVKSCHPLASAPSLPCCPLVTGCKHHIMGIARICQPGSVVTMLLRLERTKLGRPSLTS